MLKIINFSKEYETKSGKNKVLDNINIEFLEKGFYCVLGKSGSGKTTFLNLLGGLDRPDTGKLIYENEELDYNNSLNLDYYRSHYISFVFQDYNLFDDLSVYDNLKLVGTREEIKQVLTLVGLSDYENRSTKLLSGGERQRIAIARALLKNSQVLLLDEPTGNLDNENALDLYKLIKKIAKTKLVIMVTHDIENALKFCDYIVELKNGGILNRYDNVKHLLTIDEARFQDSNSITEVFDFLMGSNEITFYTEISGETKKYKIKYKDLYKIVRTIYKSSDGGKVTFYKSFDEEIADIKTNFKTKDCNHFFDFSFKFRYGIKMLFRRKIRLIISQLLIILSFFLVFLQLNFIYFNEQDTLSNAIKEEGFNLMPLSINECNMYTNTCQDYSNGKTIYNNLESFGVDNVIFYLNPIPFNTYEMNVNIVNQPNTFNNLNLTIVGSYPLGDKQILISDFLADTMSNNLNNVIGQTINVGELGPMVISGYFKTNYLANDVPNNYFNEDYYLKQIDNINMYYSSAYILKKTYVNCMSESNLVNISGGNFTLNSSATSLYVKNNVVYSAYTDSMASKIISGRAPENNNEMLISSQFLLDYFNLNSNDAADIQTDVYDKSFSYKNIMKSKDAILYQGYTNLFDIDSGSFKIVGIYQSNNNSDILTTSDFFNKIINEYIYTDAIGYKVLIKTKVAYNFVNTISKNGYVINYRFASIIYSLNTLKSALYKVLIFLQIILMLIASFILYLNFSNLINSKSKEIGIMKSLGIKKKKIVSVYLIQNFTQTFTAFVLASGFGMIAFFLLNHILCSYNLFNININILHIRIMSFLILFLISMGVFAFSTIRPAVKISMLDPIDAIKENY